MANGLNTVWHATGNKAFERRWENGELNGPRTDWYEDGEKQAEEFYADGKRHGLSIAWDRHDTTSVEGSLITYGYEVVERRTCYNDGEEVPLTDGECLVD